jgi:hypothetical protein
MCVEFVLDCTAPISIMLKLVLRNTIAERSSVCPLPANAENVARGSRRKKWTDAREVVKKVEGARRGDDDDEPLL